MNRGIVLVVAFGLMSLAEFGDAAGLVVTLGDPAPVAEMFGISVEAEMVRASLLLVLSLLIALGALSAVAGLLARRLPLFFTGSAICAGGYVVYGIYQIASGALQLGSAGVVAAGVIYVGLGVLAFVMRRSIAPPGQTSRRVR